MTLYLNDNGDIELDNLYNLKLIEEDEEVRQRNRLTLTTPPNSPSPDPSSKVFLE